MENGKFYKDKFFMGLMICVGASFAFTATLCTIIWNVYLGHCAEAKTELDYLKTTMVARDESLSAKTTEDKTILTKIMTDEFKTINMALARIETDVKYLKRVRQ